MKLDRNSHELGRGKYALLKLRKLDDFTTNEPFAELAEPIASAIKVLCDHCLIDWGAVGTESEFFVIRLKDKYATAALSAYADAADMDDREYADEIYELARRAGANHPNCKKPD